MEQRRAAFQLPRLPFTRSARKNANQDMVLAWPLLPRCCGCPVNVAQKGEYPPMAAVLNSVSLDPLPDQARRGTWSTWPFRAPNLHVLQRHSYLHKRHILSLGTGLPVLA